MIPAAPVKRSMKRIVQYGWANVCFVLRQEAHMLYLGNEIPEIDHLQQINCHNEEEASMLYDAIDEHPILVNHMHWLVTRRAS